MLGQLGNRVQQALRTFTPEDAKALVTVLSERGAPTPVAWTVLRSPRSLMAQLDPAEQQRHDGDRGSGGAGEAVSRVLGSPAFKAFARSAASALGREITRGILGTRSRRR